ncbi:hypothetical protein G7A66_13375 [Altererythrobacter sp. SALINAS58]|uniref:hypothetical protein n=1 Tax=Alteripontixanthobacter muriae TaxID=2705546 RepID=UPI001576FD72|nr:hypothetical protein [Alteripontixanthobacter muriae]NTZ44051.1 hypothetical protein [Alteripontixanthobacter muriae]
MQSRFDRSARAAREARDRLSPLFSPRAHALKSFSEVEVSEGGKGKKEGDSGSRASRASIAGAPSQPLSPEAYLELIAAIRAEHSPLALSGFREAGDEDWLAHQAGFERAVAFLRCCQVKERKGRWPCSYTLKHMAEVKDPLCPSRAAHTYVANGVLIAAAIALGFPFIRHRDKFGVGQNADFGLTVPKQLQALEPRSIGAGPPPYGKVERGPTQERRRPKKKSQTPLSQTERVDS